MIVLPTSLYYIRYYSEKIMATIAVRLDSESEATLNRLVRETGQTKSQLVRSALTSYSERDGRKKATIRPYDLMKDGIGIWRSGGLNLSKRTSDTFYEMLVEDRKRKQQTRKTAYERAKNTIGKVRSGGLNLSETGRNSTKC